MPTNRLAKLNPEIVAEVERKLGLRVTRAALPAFPRAEGVLEAAGPATVEAAGLPPPGVSRFHYEAIVERFGRPSLLVRQGAFDVAAADFWRARLDANRARLEQVIRSVGRVELVNHRASWLGTAWMIAPGVAVTNRHVAVEFTDMANGSFTIGRNPLGATYEVYVNFAAEYLQPEQRLVRVKRVLWVAPLSSAAPDVAFLELDPAEAPPPIPLAPAKPGAKSFIATIGYPAFDYRNDAADQARLFEDVYGVKRLAPGEVDLVGDDRFEHDATTLGGSSGSVVVDLESGTAVGLHFAGEYLLANYAVTAPVLAERLAALDTRPVPTRTAEPRPSLDAPDSEAPRNLDRREGYVPGFLDGFTVPLPDWTKVRGIAPRTDGAATPLLPYTHFSILMNGDRRLAAFTASNIDGEQAVAIKRKGPERWYYDPRIARGHQVGNELYSNNELDRGHLTRRLDPAWGPRQAAGEAERETFFWTNCTPQHSELNQHVWLGLEDYILENAVNRDFKACIFTGPVLKNRDPEYRGIHLPRAYWKVGVMVNTETGKLSATAYVVSQANLISDLEFAYGQYKTFQVPLAEIEKLTGLLFANSLHDADPLGKEEVAGAIRELGTLDDIRV